MIHVSNVLRGRLRRWIDEGQRRSGERLFAASDEAARQRGWQVYRTGHLGRAYRDPRFDLLTWCRACRGTGRVSYQTAPCPSCSGTGRCRVESERPRTAVR